MDVCCGRGLWTRVVRVLLYEEPCIHIQTTHCQLIIRLFILYTVYRVVFYAVYHVVLCSPFSNFQNGRNV